MTGSSTSSIIPLTVCISTDTFSSSFSVAFTSPFMNKPHIKEIDNTRIEMTFFIFLQLLVTAKFTINNILSKIKAYFSFAEVT